MNIQTYTIPKAVLLGMPAKERDFFLLAGHFANEINFLSKLVIITRKLAPEKIAERGELTQALFIQKTLAGKLYEGWQMIQRCYFKTAVSGNYNDILDDDAQEAIKQVGQYFSKKNIISKVRNSYSFHYGPNEIELTINEITSDDELDIYIAAQQINSLYYFSESVINKAMLRAVEPNNLQNSYDKLHQDVVEVLSLLLTFIHGFMKAAAGRHFVRTDENPVLEETAIGKLPSLEDVKLPFFVDTSSTSAGL